MTQQAPFSDQDFIKRFNGGFYGVLKWQDLDQLWLTIKSQVDSDATNSQWYLYSPGQEVPKQPVDSNIEQGHI